MYHKLLVYTVINQSVLIKVVSVYRIYLPTGNGIDIPAGQILHHHGKAKFGNPFVLPLSVLLQR